MNFSRFFSIDIRHDFFKSSLCGDLQLQPTLECSRLLKNYRLLFKNPEAGRYSVVAATDEQDQLPDQPVQEISFDFYLFLLNTDFISYTKLPAKETGEFYLFSSKKVDGKNQFLVKDAEVKKAPKTITGKPLLALIKIFFTGTFPVDYKLSFKAAEAKWKYYFLTNSNVKNVSINGLMAGVEFSKKETASNNGDDKVVEALTDTYPGANLTLFESNVTIPYTEIGRKDIQLINTDKNNILINHLPNPCFNENGTKIINIIN